MQKKSVIESIQSEFPKFNKACMSYAKRTRETGVILCPRAKDIERSVTGYKSRECDRVKSVSFRCRLTPESAELVERAMKRLGLTQQDLVEMLILEWARKNAPGSASSESRI